MNKKTTMLTERYINLVDCLSYMNLLISTSTNTTLTPACPTSDDRARGTINKATTLQKN